MMTRKERVGPCMASVNLHLNLHLRGMSPVILVLMCGPPMLTTSASFLRDAASVGSRGRGVPQLCSVDVSITWT